MGGSIDGNEEVPLVIDTGGFFGMWIPRSLASSMVMRELEDTQPVGMGAGPGGQTVYRAGIHELTVGDYTIGDVLTAISMLNYGDKDPGFGLIGNHLLRRYDVTLDVKRGFLHLETP